MKWELIVDGEWIYEGDYEVAENMAIGYWEDPECIHNITLITEDEFYGTEEA